MLERTQIYLKPIKAMGQNFLINRSVAEAEAEHAHGKIVLELGSGYGILTKELCERARRVVSVELDRNLYTMLKQELKYKNLKMLNKDFFDASDDELEVADADIMIANVPYKLSSRVIDFLIGHELEAVLCLQKEFVEHMTAKPGTRNYSRLSVMFQLCFNFTKIIPVSRGSFRPVPKVDSVVVYIRPKGVKIGEGERSVINAVMQHKKKSVRNALLDSRDQLRISGNQVDAALEGSGKKDVKLFKLNPEEILGLAKSVVKGS